ncbi:MAG: hypothetical protein IPP14_11605 [Planctomycetes bacterium]|nr:hypothetical protein [Planctomycetota bacterium]
MSKKTTNRKPAPKAKRKPAARKPARKATRKATPRKPAPKAKRKATPRKPARKATRKATPQPARPTLTQKEAQGLRIIKQLADSQFCSDGKLAHASGFVKGLTDEERTALNAARDRLRKTVG